MSENEIETISKDMFVNVKEEVREKPTLKHIIQATIVDEPKIRHNPINGKGETTKEKRKFIKYYFTLHFLLDQPLEVNGVKYEELYESYGFRVYSDNKSVWWGGDKSSCAQTIDKLKAYTPDLNENPSVTKVLEAFADRKVKIISKKFGPNDSIKTMIDTFV